jgi:peptidoglycan/xylan/chitin deacetylase (PgdA/CDA1 family)
MYFHKIPTWVQALFKRYLWQMPQASAELAVYLTFDDGPHPRITPWVLSQLAEFKAKATFFCIGKNVRLYPEVFQQIIGAGHSVGNHTQNHLKGRMCKNEVYLKDILDAGKVIDSKLFRPPYGSLKLSQAKMVEHLGYKIVLWSIIPGDWEQALDAQKCLENVLFNLKPGDIVVLHDSEKAEQNMTYVLPRLLAFCKDKGWAVKSIEM